MTDDPAARDDELRISDPKFAAGVDLIGRTGSTQFQIRYSDDEQPVVWMAVALYLGRRFETAAATNPLEAVMRLCKQLVDGGTCTHCKRMSAFDDDHDDTINQALAAGVCWTMWDPELKKFRRGCE